MPEAAPSWHLIGRAVDLETGAPCTERLNSVGQFGQAVYPFATASALSFVRYASLPRVRPAGRFCASDASMEPSPRTVSTLSTIEDDVPDPAVFASVLGHHHPAQLPAACLPGVGSTTASTGPLPAPLRAETAATTPVSVPAASCAATTSAATSVAVLSAVMPVAATPLACRSAATTSAALSASTQSAAPPSASAAVVVASPSASPSTSEPAVSHSGACLSGATLLASKTAASSAAATSGFCFLEPDEDNPPPHRVFAASVADECQGLLNSARASGRRMTRNGAPAFSTETFSRPPAQVRPSLTLTGTLSIF